MITRSFGNNFELCDYTQELKIVPASWTLLGDSGLFRDEMLSQHVVSFEEQNGTIGLVLDQVRGARPAAGRDIPRKLHQYAMSHHPLVDTILPQDLQGKSAYGNLSSADTEAAQLERKMLAFRKSYAITKEVARFSTLSTGNVWAPNGTLSGNFYTDFGVTRKETDFALGTATTDVVAKVEEIYASIQDSARSDEVITGITAYCSTAFFSKFIGHAKVQPVWNAQQTVDIMRPRQGGQGLYRSVFFAGINFVEVRMALGGSTLVPAGDAIFVANGVDDAFVTYYGPANRVGYANTIAEAEYLWTFRDPKGNGIDVEAEMNMINVLRKPGLVARGYTA